MAYETRSSNSSSSEAKDWSFRSTSSSSILSNNININIMDQNEEKIPYLLLNHPYYNCITTLKTPNHHHITCLAVHNNLLYAASGNQITTFDLTTLSQTPSIDDGRDLSSSGGFIKSIAFYEDNNTMLTAHQDSKIRVWKQHRLFTTLPTMKDKLGRFMCRSNYVKVRRNKSRLWISHNDAVSGLVVKHGVIYSVSWDKTLKIWRASDFKCLESIISHEDAVNALAVSDEGTVYTGSADGKIRVWERRDKDNNNNDDKVWRHSMVSSMEKHGSTVNALALSCDGKVLLSGGCDGLIMAWETDDRTVESGVVVGGHDGAVLCMIRLDGHDLFVSGGADRTVRVWGRVGGLGESGSRGLFCCMGVLEGHDKPVRSLAAVPSTSTSSSSESGVNGGVVVCSGSLDGEIKVWEIMVDELIINHDFPNFKQKF